MGNVEHIEQQIQALSANERAEFREWFVEHDWAAWDRQLERDIGTGKLDSRGEKALSEHKSGKTTRLVCRNIEE